jgi:ABC-type ATPase involved in cell division
MGTTIIIATHDLEILKNTRHKRIVKIENGQLFESQEEEKCGQYFEPLKEAGLSIL